MRLRIVAEAAEDERAALLAFVEQLEAAEMQQTEEQLLLMAAEAGMENVGEGEGRGRMSNHYQQQQTWGDEDDIENIEELAQFQYMAQQQQQQQQQSQVQQQLQDGGGGGHVMTEMVLCPVCCNACLTVAVRRDMDDDVECGEDKETQPDIELESIPKQSQAGQRVVTCDDGCGIVLNTLWYQDNEDIDNETVHHLETQPCSDDSLLCDTPPESSDDEMHATHILQQVRHRLDTVMSAHQAVCQHSLTFVTAPYDYDGDGIDSTNTNNDMDMDMTFGQGQQDRVHVRKTSPPCALWAQCQRCQQRCRVL